MESLLNRYRNITVLLLVISPNCVLLAVQVKNDQDVRMIRVWTVTAVTPVARVVEWLRSGSIGFIRNYITLHNDTYAENRHLQQEVGRLTHGKHLPQERAGTADRAKALQVFQAQHSIPDAGRQHHRHRRRVQFEGGVRQPRIRPKGSCAAWP